MRKLQEETIHHLEEEVDTSGQIPIPKRKDDNAKVNDDATTTLDAEEKFIGKFTNYHHGVAGEVFAADEQTLV